MSPTVQWHALETDAAGDLALLEEHALSWSELERRIEAEKPQWRLETENELLAVQSVDQRDRDKASRQLLEKRLTTAKETLAQVGDLDNAESDLELLRAAVDKGLASQPDLRWSNATDFASALRRAAAEAGLQRVVVVSPFTSMKDMAARYVTPLLTGSTTTCIRTRRSDQLCSPALNPGCRCISARAP